MFIASKKQINNYKNHIFTNYRLYGNTIHHFEKKNNIVTEDISHLSKSITSDIISSCTRSVSCKNTFI